MSKERDFAKYQKLHIETIKRKINEWLKTPHREVSTEELYRFFHSVKGTAASINLLEASEVAEVLLQTISSTTKQFYDKQSLQLLLEPFIKVVYQYDEIKLDAVTINELKNTNERFVLVIDDDFSMLQFLKHSLEEQGYHVLATIHPDQALHLWYNFEPDCVIIDVNLPQKNGFEVIQEFQQTDRVFVTPIIMISVDNTKSTRITAFESGADDFIAKPIEIDELSVRIKRQIIKRETFERNMLVDYMTGAFNRQFFEKELHHRLSEYRRNDQCFVIAVVDIDYFKKINDQYGHLVGDEVLKKFVQFFKENIRAEDYVIRYGGEEFVLLLPNTNAIEAKQMIEALLASFSKKVFESKKGDFSVTFSAGVAEVNDAAFTEKEWFELADIALYRAKNNGRNQVVIAQNNLEKTKSVFNIAVIDDDFIVRSMLEEHFLKAFSTNNEYAFNFRTFEDGEQFLKDDWHKKKEPYLIILDRMMPNVGGFEVLQYLRTHFPVHQYMIIMLTARHSDEDVSEALELGADDYVTKPFSVMELEARVKRTIKRMK